MAPKLFRLSRFIFVARLSPNHPIRTFTSSFQQCTKVNSHFLSRIAAAEKTLTNSDQPVKNGPTARAQSHVGKELDAEVIRAITEGEKSITGSEKPVKGGPTSVAQSILTSGSSADGEGRSTAARTSSSKSRSTDGPHTGVLDSNTLSKIAQAEKELTGEERPIRGGPTAKAQHHANEPITSQALHDITEGEKKITGGERVKGGPTSTAQSELGKSRN
ncbi:hypothetical protein BKA66DRAFT_516408 [Pyrenochaeta sp. MPI-SDFR-AT-0127]|nr:hypothetical protein BKA66DRAFT_516408 [Pyrenochaeta sp. MPI-SDFR-AT-0127]